LLCATKNGRRIRLKVQTSPRNKQLRTVRERRQWDDSPKTVHHAEALHGHMKTAGLPYSTPPRQTNWKKMTKHTRNSTESEPSHQIFNILHIKKCDNPLWKRNVI
jgi:hypothetical protein